MRSSQVILGEHPLAPVGSALQDPSLHWNGVLTGQLLVALQFDQLAWQLKSGQMKLVGGQNPVAAKQLLSMDSGKRGSYLQKGLHILSGQRNSPSAQSLILRQLGLVATQPPLGQR